MSAPAVPLDRERYRYKMKDLCEATGLDRQAIHFYIQQGLLPPGHKTGRNMAWYGEEHLERLRLIRKLQHERFLPLKAIKAMLDGRGEAFSPSQHQFLQAVKERLGSDLAPRDAREETVDAEELLERNGVEREDLDRAVALGLVGAARDAQGRLRIAADDAWMFELFGEARRIGLTRDLGFCVDDIAFYEEAMNDLLQKEVVLLSSRLAHLPADEAAAIIERALPIVHRFLTRSHAQKVRDFFSNLL